MVGLYRSKHKEVNTIVARISKDKNKVFVMNSGCYAAEFYQKKTFKDYLIRDYTNRVCGELIEW